MPAFVGLLSSIGGITDPKELIFVKIREEHLPEIMRIEPEAYPEPWTEGMFRQEIGNAWSYFYVVFHEDILVGYGGFWLAMDEAHITSVTVRSEYRRRGYGRRIASHLLKVASEMGLALAALEVRESNVRAQNLYRSLGFEQVGRRKRYYAKTGEDALLMNKTLLVPLTTAPRLPED